MKTLIISILLLTLFTGCSDKTGVKAFLESQGYTSVTTEQGNIMFCGKGDISATKFWAKSPTGFDTKGVVCSGVFKGKTIRYF